VLVLTLKEGDVLQIGPTDDGPTIYIIVRRVKGRSVRLVIKAPRDTHPALRIKAGDAAKLLQQQEEPDQPGRHKK